MTLLSMCQNVCDAIAIQRPSTIIGSTNETARRCLIHIRRTCQDLVRRHTWSALVGEHSITTANGTASYALPGDFDRYIDDTAWDATNYWQMRGSLTPSEWQWAKRSIVATATNRRRFRVKWDASSSARRIFIDPTPTTADSLVLEYVSKYFCEDSGGDGQADWAADDDVPRLEPELIELGLTYRLLNSLGQPYAEEKQEYDMRVVRAIGQDMPARVLDMSGTRMSDIPNLPDGNFGNA